MPDPYQQYCITQQQTGRYRTLPDTIAPEELLIDFSNNDYLSLAQSPLLYEAALRTGYQYGVGTTGARLLSGNSTLFTELEARIARDKGTEAALIMNSGFLANSTVLASLLNPTVLRHPALVFFDKLNHASLYQAVFLSKATLIRYRHNDMQHLHDLLKKFQHSLQPKFIVAETVFGMDGDILPLADIVRLARQYHALLYLDEAHATGILGPYGYGLTTAMAMHDIAHVIMGTFSKALGCMGAYIACTEPIKNYLVNACPGFIYATSLSPMVIGAAAKAWDIMPSLNRERQSLLSKAVQLRQALHTAGFNTAASATHIIPIILEKEKTVMHAKALLLKAGIVASAIRPPTVPPNTSRLRIALNTRHKPGDIARLLGVLKQL